MAQSSTNGIIDLLERLVNILKEEHAFDRSGDHPVVRFLHPTDLQVSSNLTSCDSYDSTTCDTLSWVYQPAITRARSVLFNIDRFSSILEIFSNMTPEEIAHLGNTSL